MSDVLGPPAGNEHVVQVKRVVYRAEVGTRSCLWSCCREERPTQTTSFFTPPAQQGSEYFVAAVTQHGDKNRAEFTIQGNTTLGIREGMLLKVAGEVVKNEK